MTPAKSATNAGRDEDDGDAASRPGPARSAFAILSGARIECAGCSAVLAACDVDLVEVTQVDLDDVLELQIRCPLCKASGALRVSRRTSGDANDRKLLSALGRCSTHQPAVAPVAAA